MSYAIARVERICDDLNVSLLCDDDGEFAVYATSAEAVEARPSCEVNTEYFAVDLDKISTRYFGEDGDELCWDHVDADDILKLPCVLRQICECSDRYEDDNYCFECAHSRHDECEDCQAMIAEIRFDGKTQDTVDKFGSCGDCPDCHKLLNEARVEMIESAEVFE